MRKNNALTGYQAQVRFLLVTACLTMVLLATLLPPFVSAQTDRWTFPLTRLGLTEPIRLAGTLSRYNFSIPVPAGMRPISITLRLQTSPNIRDGHLALLNKNTTLSVIALPTSTQTISLALDQAQLEQGRINLAFQAILNPSDDICASATLNWLELTELAVVLAGSADSPQTVAEFWPPDLAELHLYTSPTPSPAEAEAVLKLAAFAARLGAGHPVTVTVSALETSSPLPTAPLDPFSRAVVVRPTGQADIALQGDLSPLLLISGPPETLTQTVAALTAYPTTFIAPQAEVISFNQPDSLSGPLRTLSSLGWPQVQLEGVGQMESHLAFSQADLGGPVSQISAHLGGTYSSLPEGGQADVQVFINDSLIRAEPLGQAGQFDMSFQIPASLLHRDNILTFRVNYTPAGGECRLGQHPLTVRLDGASFIQFEREQSLPPGFERFPQALLPTFEVALTPLNIDTLGQASQLVATLQRLSQLSLDPRVISAAAGSTSHLPLLLLAQNDPSSVAGLKPPLLPSPFNLNDNRGAAILQTKIAQPFAVLEAFEHNQRDVLLLTSYQDAATMNSLVEGLNQDPLGWYGLTGNVWLWPVAGRPVSLHLGDEGLRVEPLPGPPTWWAMWLRPLVLGLILLLVIIFLIWAYPRVIRQHAA